MASVKGGAVSIDPDSVSEEHLNPTLKSFLGDSKFLQPQSTCMALIVPWGLAWLDGTCCTHGGTGELHERLKHTQSVEEVMGGEIEKFDGVFIPGGCGIMWDGPEDPALCLLVETMYADHKVCEHLN